MMTEPFATTPAGGTWTLRISDTGFPDIGAVAAAYLALTLDTTAPDTAVEGPRSGAKVRHRPTYELSSPDMDVASYLCKVDRGRWDTCTSPFTPQVRQGRHHLRVSAVDTSTNLDQSSATTSFVYQTKRCHQATKKLKKAKRAYKKAKKRGHRKAIKKAKKRLKQAKRLKNRRCR